MNDQELDQILDAWKTPDAPLGMRERFAAAIPPKPRRRGFGVKPRWILAFGLAAGALAVGQSLVTNATLGSDAGAWDVRTFWRRTRIVHPAIAWLRWRSAKVGNSGARRDAQGNYSGMKYLVEPSSNTRRGYEWSAEPQPGGQYRMTAKPLDPTEPAEVRTVAPGSAFDIDLYHEGIERVYDHWEVSAAPMDAALPQLPQTLVFAQPHLYIDGKLASGPGGVVKTSGPVVFATVPGRGSYYLSLRADLIAGYQATGRVHGNTIEWTMDGESFRVECSDAIEPADQTVYVLFKADPAAKNPGFGAGGPR